MCRKEEIWMCTSGQVMKLQRGWHHNCSICNTVIGINYIIMWRRQLLWRFPQGHSFCVVVRQPKETQPVAQAVPEKARALLAIAKTKDIKILTPTPAKTNGACGNAEFEGSTADPVSVVGYKLDGGISQVQFCKKTHFMINATYAFDMHLPDCSC